MTLAVIEIDSLEYLRAAFGAHAAERHLFAVKAILDRHFGAGHVRKHTPTRFVVTGQSLLALRLTLLETRHEFPGISFGTGYSLEQALDKLSTDVVAREACRRRALAGERPVWITK